MLAEVDATGLPLVRRGKVRDVFAAGEDRLVLVATDRLSAFDRVLGCVPGKGRVLTAVSAWWFEQLRPVVAHHLIDVPHPAVSVVHRCETLPVEVVVRGYLTGVTSTSMWTRYEQGQRVIDGIRLPDGLERNSRLPRPLVTPTTKAPDGAHDEPLSVAEVADRGLVAPSLWADVVDIALHLFARGTALASTRGLVLVDTKYEFGVLDGRPVLIDEVHTPDSSRFWDGRAEAAADANMDKEIVRRWYAAQGYRGEGDPPPMSPELVASVADAYGEVAARLCGRPPVVTDEDGEEDAVREVVRELTGGQT